MEKENDFLIGEKFNVSRSKDADSLDVSHVCLKDLTGNLMNKIACNRCIGDPDVIFITTTSLIIAII